MSLRPSISLCSAENCKSLNLFDGTGDYNANTNSGGYGIINPDMSDVEIVSIVITLPDGTVYTDTTAVGNVPETGTPVLSVTGEDLGFGVDSYIADGIYTVTNTIHDNTVPPLGALEYSATATFLITCQLQACLDAKLVDIKTADCNCEDTNIDRLFRAYLILYGAQTSAFCGKIDSAQKKIDTLKDFCNFSECKTCN